MDQQRRKIQRFTPEKTQAWSLALYPACVLILTAFMIIAERKVTPDVIGLFIGLLTAGSLQVVIKKRGNDAKSDDTSNSDSNLRGSSDPALEDDYRRWSDNPDRWRHRNKRLLGIQMGRLSTAPTRIRRVFCSSRAGPRNWSIQYHFS